ncbi:hypothetical protein B0H12DRAFT_1091245 [Mycena haematopus]|nr:hypothetical protein B0H12DRAFT_1091245 [Mycena haematopus]
MRLSVLRGVRQPSFCWYEIATRFSSEPRRRCSQLQAGVLSSRHLFLQRAPRSLAGGTPF